MSQDGTSNWPPVSKKDENIEVEYAGEAPKVGISFENTAGTLELKTDAGLKHETPAPQETFMPFPPDKNFNSREAVLARLNTYKQNAPGEALPELAPETSTENTGQNKEVATENREANASEHRESGASTPHNTRHGAHETRHGAQDTHHGHAKESFMKKWGKRAGGLFAGIIGSIFHLLGHMWKHKPHFDLGNGLDSGGGGGGKKKAPAHH